jgi:hypothetical protein
MEIKEELDQNDELKAHMQSLKQHPGYLYLVKQIEAFKAQTLNEILNKDKTDKEKGEFTAYGRVLNLPDKIIQDLSTSANEINLDPYK